jgi:hypothetical protein
MSGPWLAGITLLPSVVDDAWCHQKDYACLIEESAPGHVLLPALAMVPCPGLRARAARAGIRAPLANFEMAVPARRGGPSRNG